MICATMTLRKKLQFLMEEHRYNARTLSEKLGIGRGNVAAWVSEREEDQSREPTKSQALQIARLFGLDLESLLDDDLELAPASLPADEQTLLDTYRVLKANTGLKVGEACVRLSGPTPPFRGERAE